MVKVFMERSLWGQKDGLRWTSRKWSKLSFPIFLCAQRFPPHDPSALHVPHSLQP